MSERYRRASTDVNVSVEVEAERWDGTEASQASIVTWSQGAVSGWFDGRYFLSIGEGADAARVDPGDWVAQVGPGNYRRIAADDFEATYEPVTA